jgi:hypothetical protein
MHPHEHFLRQVLGILRTDHRGGKMDHALLVPADQDLESVGIAAGSGTGGGEVRIVCSQVNQTTPSSRSEINRLRREPVYSRGVGGGVLSRVFTLEAISSRCALMSTRSRTNRFMYTFASPTMASRAITRPRQSGKEQAIAGQ